MVEPTFSSVRSSETAHMYRLWDPHRYVQEWFQRRIKPSPGVIGPSAGTGPLPRCSRIVLEPCHCSCHLNTILRHSHWNGSFHLAKAFMMHPWKLNHWRQPTTGSFGDICVSAELCHRAAENAQWVYLDGVVGGNSPDRVTAKLALWRQKGWGNMRSR